MPISELTDRAVIRFSGKDMIPFLQGVVTNDARKLEKGEMLYALLLTPQGKFLHDFFLYPQSDGTVLMDVMRARANDLMAKLKLYKLRSDVAMELLDDEWSVWTMWDAEATTGMLPDPRLAALGFRMVAKKDAITLPALPTGNYHAHRITLGVSEGIYDLIPEKSFPMEYGLEAFNSIDFAKGCYVGQEVTARTKYRGHVKKRIYKIRSKDLLPAAATLVMAGAEEVGELRSNAGNIGLALLRIETVEKALAAQTPLNAGTSVLEIY